MVREYRYEFLLAGLIVFLVTIPVADEFLGEGAYVAPRLAFVALLLLGVASLRPGRRWFVAGLVLMAVGVTCNLAALVWPATAITIVAQLISVTFAALIIMIALADVLFRGPTDAHKIVGAVCIYLLVGVAWMLLYNLAETLVPGSFEGLESVADHERSMELLYYSYVTLSTLGYGEITPVGALARVLAWSEAIFGQLYLTILVAALVGMHLSSRHGHAARASEGRGGA